MAITGISITKSTSFRGIQQEFANTYYYGSVIAPNATVAESLVDQVVALEKPMFSANTTFVRAKAWSAGGTQAQNQMLVQKNLSGVGTNVATPGTNIDKERAFLVRFRAGNDTKGRPVYLRKWWHLDLSLVNNSAITNGQLQNTAALNSTQRQQLVDWANSFKNLTVNAAAYNLVSEKGRSIDGDTIAHQYFEHHQLGDMWR